MADYYQLLHPIHSRFLKMVKENQHNSSGRNYSSVSRKIHLEICGFILSAVLIVIGVVSHLIAKRIYNSNQCSKYYTQYMENITDSMDCGNGTLHTKNGMRYPLTYYWTSGNGTIWGCPCLLKPCIYKCCEEDESHIYTDYSYNGTIYPMVKCANYNRPLNQKYIKVYSAKNDTFRQEIIIKEDHFFVLSEGEKLREMSLLNELEKQDIYLLDNGSVYRTNHPKSFWNYTEFCVETSNKSSEIHFSFDQTTESEEEVTQNASNEEENKWFFYIRIVGILISVPFLFFTLLTYALLPKLKNLHGKAIICYVTSLLVAYPCLAIIHLNITLSEPVCIGIAFVIQFSILTSFFWMNVMSFDIWWVFSGLMPLPGSKRDTEHLKFLFYSLYAWGCPLLILIGTLIIDYAPGIPNSIVKPGMGVVRCFFKEDDALLLYLYLPIGILVYLNTAMFLMTSLRFKSHSKSVKKLQRGDSRRHCRSGHSTSEVERFDHSRK